MAPCGAIVFEKPTSSGFIDSYMTIKLFTVFSLQDEKGEFTLAMGLYENALEALLNVHNKSQGRKKELLREEVCGSKTNMY